MLRLQCVSIRFGLCPALYGRVIVSSLKMQESSLGRQDDPLQGINFPRGLGCGIPRGHKQADAAIIVDHRSIEAADGTLLASDASAGQISHT